MKLAKNDKKLVLIIVTIVILIIGGIIFFFVSSQKSSCEGTACASGENCIAPNDAIVKCEDLEKNPTKTDWR
jgi:flagellar basal body-associated protein FliL